MNQLVMERAVRKPASAGRRAHGRGSAAPVVPARRVAVASVTAVPRQPHEWRTLAAVSVAVLGVLLLGTWSFAQGWGRGPVVGAGELAVDGGIVRVDGVVSAARPQHAMPGMGADEDPVPDGQRRVSVDVTLLAGTDTMDFAVERFGLVVDGEEADHLTHRDILPGDQLPAGTQLSGTMLFDVPADATAATLTYDGAGSTDVVLPAEEEQSAGSAPAGDAMTGAGHGAAGHGADSGTGTGTNTVEDTTEAGR